MKANFVPQQYQFIVNVDERGLKNGMIKIIGDTYALVNDKNVKVLGDQTLTIPISSSQRELIEVLIKTTGDNNES